MSLRIKLQLRHEGADLRISLPPPEARIRSASTFLGPPPDHEGHDVSVDAFERSQDGHTSQRAQQRKSLLDLGIRVEISEYQLVGL